MRRSPPSLFLAVISASAWRVASFSRRVNPSRPTARSAESRSSRCTASSCRLMSWPRAAHAASRADRCHCRRGCARRRGGGATRCYSGGRVGERSGRRGSSASRASRLRLRPCRRCARGAACAGHPTTHRGARERSHRAHVAHRFVWRRLFDGHADVDRLDRHGVGHLNGRLVRRFRSRPHTRGVTPSRWRGLARRRPRE